MEEIWKPIKGYEQYYEVSNLGRIKSLARNVYWKNRANRINSRYDEEKIIVPDVMKNGYIRIKFRVNGDVKQKTVHRVVAEAFIPNPENKPCINHKDGDRKNNKVENLEWCTYSENNLHEWRVLCKKSYNAKKVRCIDLNLVFDSVSDGAKYMGSCKQSLFNALYKRDGVFKGLKWEFI